MLSVPTLSSMSIDDHYGCLGILLGPFLFSVPENYFTREVNISRELLGKGALARAGISVRGSDMPWSNWKRQAMKPTVLEPPPPFRDRAISKIGVDPQRPQSWYGGDASYPPASFDFINLCVVLEHIGDPGAALTRALTWQTRRRHPLEVPSADWLIVRLTNLYYRLRERTWSATSVLCIRHTTCTVHPPSRFAHMAGAAVYSGTACLRLTYLPKFLDVMRATVMAWTGTGMEVAVWLRKGALETVAPPDARRLHHPLHSRRQMSPRRSGRTVECPYAPPCPNALPDKKIPLRALLSAPPRSLWLVRAR